MDPKSSNDGSAPYEEAISLTGHGKFNYGLTLIGGLAIMTSLLANVDITYILPASECELNLEKTDRGILSGAYFIGVVVSSHLLGFLSDTLGRRYIIVRASFINVIVYIISSMSFNYWSLLIARLITGIVLCGVLTCGLVYVGEFHSNQHRTRAVMLVNTLSSGAFLYCAGFGWLILPHEWTLSLFFGLNLTPWRLYYLVLGIPSLIVGIIFYLLPESPKYLLAANKKDRALEILTKVYSYNTDIPGEHYPVKNLLQNPNEQISKLVGNSKSAGAVVEMIWNQTYPLFMPPHLLNMIFSCTITFSLFYNFSGVLIWIPDIINQLLILKDDFVTTPMSFCDVVESNWTANLARVDDLEPLPEIDIYDIMCESTLKASMFQLNTVIGVMVLLVLAAASFILPKVNRKAFVSLSCFSIIVVFIVLLSVRNVYVILVCLALIVNILSIVFCGTTTLLVDYFPTNFRAMAVCLAIMMARLGSAVGGHIFSLFLLENCELMFYIGGFLMLLAGLSCISLRSPNKNETANTNPQQ